MNVILWSVFLLVSSVQIQAGPSNLFSILKPQKVERGEPSQKINEAPTNLFELIRFQNSIPKESLRNLQLTYDTRPPLNKTADEENQLQKVNKSAAPIVTKPTVSPSDYIKANDRISKIHHIIGKLFGVEGVVQSAVQEVNDLLESILTSIKTLLDSNVLQAIAEFEKSINETKNIVTKFQFDIQGKVLDMKEQIYEIKEQMGNVFVKNEQKNAVTNNNSTNVQRNGSEEGSEDRKSAEGQQVGAYNGETKGGKIEEIPVEQAKDVEKKTPQNSAVLVITSDQKDEINKTAVPQVKYQVANNKISNKLNDTSTTVQEEQKNVQKESPVEVSNLNQKKFNSDSEKLKLPNNSTSSVIEKVNLGSNTPEVIISNSTFNSTKVANLTAINKPTIISSPTKINNSDTKLNNSIPVTTKPINIVEKDNNFSSAEENIIEKTEAAPANKQINNSFSIEEKSIEDEGGFFSLNRFNSKVKNVIREFISNI